jgi:pilus assembly protein CpaF
MIKKQNNIDVKNIRNILSNREFWYTPLRDRKNNKNYINDANKIKFQHNNLIFKERSVADYQNIKSNLHEKLVTEIEEKGLYSENEQILRIHIEEFAQRILSEGELLLNDRERQRLTDDLLEETLGLGPLALLMSDPAISDILVNGPKQVYVERFGKLQRVQTQFRDSEHLTRIIQRIVSRVGRRVDEASPMVDARLPDGSRVNATLPPVSVDGPCLSIRRFGRYRLRQRELVQLSTLSKTMLIFLDLVVKSRKNVLISGGTGAGKSTLLGALVESVPTTERIITIEDIAELILDQEHVVRLETRPSNIEGRGRITTRDLVINSLRMRPDRIIVGEARGSEALDMLQAMNTGHDGSLATIHANSPRDALARLETMALMAELDLPAHAIREQIVSAIQILVHIRRYEDGIRRIQSIAELDGIEMGNPRLREIYRFERHGRHGKILNGEFIATGIIPNIKKDIESFGFEMSDLLFSNNDKENQ